jgi:hypothetical protein
MTLESRWILSLFLLASVGCERGCGWGWLRAHGVGGALPISGRGALPIEGLDCPDGLARCVEGTVETSRLAVIPQPCRGPESVCACPWERAASSCERGCVADGIEVVIDRAQATTQLCAPRRDANTAIAWRAVLANPKTAPPAPTCDEGQLYRCTAGSVVDCAAHVVLASCTRGCFADGAAIDESAPELPIAREAAFAIFCSR